MRAPATINTIMYPYNYHLIDLVHDTETDSHYAIIGDGYADAELETFYKISLSAQEAEEIDLYTEGDLRNVVRNNNAIIIK